MLSYNACGLASSILELEQCALEYSVDIILVQETFLKPKNPKCCKLNNYVQLRTDRQGAPKGGTALYYRQTLNCSPIDIPPLINLEATGCRLTMSSHGAIIIISVYLPPKKGVAPKRRRNPLRPGGCRHPLWRSKFKKHPMEMQLHKRKRTKNDRPREGPTF
ncbi:hypothetical protein EVAR_52512_1 [Eumeta japonica]|uniref:RNA-directed DNA polymerase from mobile element jockey n=1 Tax=Eumeta variegata TaxID=151549 RepID=A0A4C1ZQ43_EUMVA|nr:hypothetical protein EVAR_52512_1 [Eumeta japonica]